MQNLTPIPSRGEKTALALAGALADGARIVIPVVAALVGLAVISYAWLAVAELFARLGADVLSQILAGAASVGVLIALAGVLALARAAHLRALAAIYTIAWLPIVLALVGLASALRSELIAVPHALTTSGRVAAGLLAGLALLPVITLGVASRRADGGDVRAALGYYVSNALKLVILAATAGANVAFGVARGVPVEVAAFVAVVLETAFLVALLRVRDGALHAAALIAFGAALGLVAVETMTALTNLRALANLAALGEALYLLTPALALSYVVAAALTDRHGRTEATPRVSILRGMARHISALREDAGALRQALASERRERLPEPTPTVFSANGHSAPAHSAPAEVGADPKSG